MRVTASTRGSLHALTTIRHAQRAVHPGAWWAWALCLAIAASSTHHPLLLAMIVAVAASVVVARRTDAPWSRSFGMFLKVGLAVVAIRTIAQVVFGVPSTGTVIMTLPSVHMPAWAAGIAIGGPVTDTALASAVTEGLRLATILACIGAANALANAKRLLASLPAALYEIGTAAVIALSLVPALASSVQRVRSARRLRGLPDRGIAAWKTIAMPVVDDALARSLTLAAAMDARGYGRSLPVTPIERRSSAALLLAGLCGLAIGVVTLLNAQLASSASVGLVASGGLLAITGIAIAGRRSPRSRYRPDPWAGAEWLTVSAAATTLGAVIATTVLNPAALQPALIPVTSWPLPWLPTAGIVVAMLPGVVTPKPAPASSLASAPAVRHAPLGTPS